MYQRGRIHRMMRSEFGVFQPAVWLRLSWNEIERGAQKKKVKVEPINLWEQ